MAKPKRTPGQAAYARQYPTGQKKSAFTITPEGRARGVLRRRIENIEEERELISIARDVWS